MATRTVHVQATTGWTVYAVVIRLSDGKVFDWNDNTWKTLGTAVTPGVSMASLLTIGALDKYAATINLATINATTTPSQVVIGAYRRLGGSPAPATDTAIGEGDSFTIVGGAVVREETHYRIICTVDVTTTSGDNAHVKVQVFDGAGNLIDMDAVDSSATCAVAVQRDGVFPQFSLSTANFGAPNANGWFEANYADPAFSTDIGYTATATVVSGGVTYTGVCNFNVWP